MGHVLVLLWHVSANVALGLFHTDAIVRVKFARALAYTRSENEVYTCSLRELFHLCMAATMLTTLAKRTAGHLFIFLCGL